MICKYLYLPFVAGLLLYALTASAKGSSNLKNHPTLQFVQNVGQVTDQYKQPRVDIDARLCAAKGLNVFVGDGALHYQWIQSSTPAESQQAAPALYRMDVQLIGANTEASVSYEEQKTYVEQYYTGGVADNHTAQSFARLRYKDIYPDIDWVLYTTSSGQLKYDFIVHPGGKVSDIKIKYSGATALSLQKDGSLSVESPMGSIGEHAPVSFTREGKAVGSRFVLVDSVVSFAVDDYDGTLVIDPELSWSTYKGGASNDHADAVTTDLWGNVYISGYTLSNDNIVTTGAFQTTYGGSNVASNAGDAFIAKYNCSGELVWATYYGGAAGERGWNVVADDYGHIYVAGFTNLLSGLPSTDNLATAGSHQSTAGGGDGDAFLVKLDSAGNRIWATYYGGTGREAAATIPVGLALDKSGHVYLCGTTNSTNAIASTGAHQATPGGGNDAFLVQFDTAGVRQWATYYGGTGVDRGEAVRCDTAGNVYLTGISNSAVGIATTGSHQGTLGGGSDAFLVKFDVDGVRQWGTYYGGSGSTDQGMSLFTDTALNVYLAGRTNSSTGIASTGSFQDTYGGGMYDAFLCKFDGDGLRQWGTYFGGFNNGALQGYNALTGDSRGNILMTGMARGTDSIATPGSFQETASGADDGFIANFSSTGALYWATYYGGAGNDWFTGIAVDAMGNLYLAGGTTSDAAFATAGSDQDALSGGYDAFLLKFNDTASLVAIDTVYGAVTACAGTEQLYSIDAVPGAISYNWALPSGWSGTSDSTSIAIALDETSGVLSVNPVFPCAVGSAYNLTVEVIQAEVTLLSDTSGCVGDTLQLNATVVDELSWQWLLSDAAIAGATDSSLLVDASGYYSVIIAKGSCTDTSDAVSITIHGLPDVAIIVSGDTLKATGGFATYQWYHEGTLIGGAVSDRYIPLIDGSYSVQVTDTNGCAAMSEVFDFEQPTGLDDIGLALGIAIQPNPATDLLTVKAGKAMEARLRSMDGRTMAAFEVPGTLDVSMLPAGVYILQLTDTASGFSKAFKVVKSAAR